MKKRVLTTSITPNEVLFVGASITVQSSEALDTQSAQGGIVVDGMRGRVQVARGGKSATWSSEQALTPRTSHAAFAWPPDQALPRNC